MFLINFSVFCLCYFVYVVTLSPLSNPDFSRCGFHIRLFKLNISLHYFVENHYARRCQECVGVEILTNIRRTSPVEPFNLTLFRTLSPIHQFHKYTDNIPTITLNKYISHGCIWRDLQSPQRLRYGFIEES